MQILNDILDYSKIEAGKLDLEKTFFSIEDTLVNCVDLFSGITSEKGIEVYLDIDIWGTSQSR